MSKYVVTGGAGFIGSHVVEELVKHNEEVIVIDNLSTGKLENLKQFINKIKFVKGNITDSALLRREFSGVDFVIHLAALPSVPRSIKDPISSNENNITGTLNIFEVAKDLKLKVIYASSSSVYGDSAVLPKSENMPFNPLSFYAVQKQTDEQYAALYSKIYGCDFIGLRFFNVFGPRQDPDSEYSAVIPKFIALIKNSKSPTIYGDGLTSRDFTYVKNVVHGILLACKSNNSSGHVFNIACGDRITLNQLANDIQEILNKKVKINYAPHRTGDIKHSQADISKAKTMLKYSPKFTFKQGLMETVKAYG